MIVKNTRTGSQHEVSKDSFEAMPKRHKDLFEIVDPNDPLPAKEIVVISENEDKKPKPIVPPPTGNKDGDKKSTRKNNKNK